MLAAVHRLQLRQVDVNGATVVTVAFQALEVIQQQRLLAGGGGGAGGAGWAGRSA